jgi:hypothetical protein
MDIWDGMWCLRLISTIFIPLDTGYRYALVHSSFTYPYLVNASLIFPSGTSGSRLVILIILIHIPALSINTCENSTWSCWNFSFQSVSCSTVCLRVLFVNLMKMRRLGPSIWIIRTSSSANYNFSCVHSCIWNAVTRGLRGSNMHTIVFCRSPILVFVFLL